MTSERRARDTYTEVQRLNMAVQTLSETSLLGLPVTHDDVFKLLEMTRIAAYHACRAMDSAHRDEGRRKDDTRFPAFDGVESAQMDAAASTAVAVEVRQAVAVADPAPSLGEQVRRALAKEGQS